MKIRRRRVISGGRCQDYWQLDLGRVEGRRVRRNFKTRSAAQDAMTLAKREKDRLGAGVLALTPQDRLALTTALERLKPVGASLREVIDFYLKFHREIPKVTLREAIDALIADKRRANKRPRYLRALQGSLDRFALTRPDVPVKEVQRAEIEDWLNGNGWSPKTRANYLTDLRTFFTWCGRKKWLVENPAAHIDKPALDRGRPEILTADQAAHLMATAHRTDPGLCGYLALALFAGIRPEELEKLDPAAVDLKAERVRIPAAVSKTRRDRDVPISANLAAWLRLGVNLPVVNFRTRFRRVREAAGLFKGWPHDVLRHTFGSFHVAAHHSLGLAAKIMGNSETVAARHYVDHVGDPEAVAKFWRIVP